MNWYYAEAGQQRGPFDDAAWSALLAEGKIKPDTLVWHEELEKWTPYAQLTAQQPPEIPAIVETAEPETLDPDVLAGRIIARGYDVHIGSCIGRAASLVRSRFLLTAGTTFVVYLILMTGGLIPILGFFIGLLINGPLLGGLYWFFIRLARGEDASVGDGFAGFSRNFLQLILCSIAIGILVMVWVMPGVMMLGIARASHPGQPPLGAALLTLLGLIPMIYFSVAWIFSIPLVVDKKMDFWPAMQLSRRIVHRRWWQMFGLLFVCGLLVFVIVFVAVLISALLGASIIHSAEMQSKLAIIGLIAGVMVLAIISVLPIIFASYVYAYEDIFNPHPAETLS